jgi:N-acetylmuramoyl-L-alanine amidase
VRRSLGYCVVLMWGLLLVSSSALAERRSITIVGSARNGERARAIDSLGVVYLAVNDFISALDLPFGESVETRKIEFRLPTYRLKVTADNPYLVITDLSTKSASVYQLSLPSVFESGVYYVPLLEFMRVLSFIWNNALEYDARAMALKIDASPPAPTFDITQLEVDQKLNGYLLTLKAPRRLGEVEAWLKPDGWLFVTVTDAKADAAALSKVKPTGPIKKVLVFQSPTSVQLTFQLSPDVVKAEVIDDPSTTDLQLSLRTQTSVERAELERARQASVRQSLERDRDRWKMDVIVIDAGHGGRDPGTIGVRGTREKDIALAIALKLGKLIEQKLPDVKVVYTRTDDSFVELYKRAQIANEVGGKLFVSIHCNSTPRKPSSPNGFEIYLLRPGKTESAIEIAERENAVVKLEEGYEQRYQELTEENFILVTMQQMAFMKYSETFAEIAARAMSKSLKIKNSGVKQAGFYVLVGASMPNVLVEVGYLSNRNEEGILRSSSGQQKIAEALFDGILEYRREYEKGIQAPETTSREGR